MTLSSLIRKRDTGILATAIPAISATRKGEGGGTVARIATVAVANPKEEKTTSPAKVSPGDRVEVACCPEAILGDIKKKGAAAIKSAYQRRVSNDASKPGADTIMRRIGDAGPLVYVDLAKSRPALTGVTNEEASAKAGFLAGGRNVAINTGDRGDLPTQATTTDELKIASRYAAVNGDFVRWQVVGEKLRNMIAREQVKTDMDLLKWIRVTTSPRVGADLPKPDPIPDDRRTCSQCLNLRGRACTIAKPERGALVVANRGYRPAPDTLHRCAGYLPNTADDDQRMGRERWPGL